MTITNCPACAFALDAADNFCRSCGISIGNARLPATRGATSVTMWRPPSSPVVKGAAVMAMGTIGQFVVRRAIGSFVGGGSPKNKGRSIFGGRANDGLVDDAQIITETMMVRRVRIRRQA